MNFHSVHLLLLAYRAREQSRRDANRENALTDDSILAIVMAAAATEAFVNEFAEYVDLQRQTLHGAWGTAEIVAPKLCAFAAVLRREPRMELREKYKTALRTLDGAAYDVGKSPFQDFTQLVRLRNAIMHMKPVTGEADHEGAAVTDALARRGIATRAEATWNLPWFDRLQVPQTAEWACDSARAIILAVLSFVPDSADGLADPFEMWKRSFRDHDGFR